MTGMIGRKVGMMRLFDGAGHARGVTVIEVGQNFITQVRTPDRDGYAAVQVGFPGAKKRTNRPQRGHLRAAGLEGRSPALTALREFRVDDPSAYTLGQQLQVDSFEAGAFVDVTARSKGRGFQGGVKRWGFRGGPKTHGQSDRHRAPGSIGSGTTPGRVFKGLKMAGHMGDKTVTVLNLLIVAVDPARNLIFVEGSVPGPRTGLVTLGHARRKPLTGYVPPVIPGEIEAPAEEAAEEMVEEEALAAEAPIEEPAAEVVEEDAPAAEQADETADVEAVAETPEDEQSKEQS